MTFPIHTFSFQQYKDAVESLGPWHYCHVFPPYNISTGDCDQESTHPKLVELLSAGAFKRTVYRQVLDLGANSGLISMWFVDNKRSIVTAVEGNPLYYPQLEFAISAKDYLNTIKPVYMNLHQPMLGLMMYDLVLFLGTLHHLKPESHVDVLKACGRALKPAGELVVQTDSSLPVEELMEQAGFEDVTRLATNWSDRAAWIATRDPMKVWDAPINQDLTKLWEAMGYVVLMNHWLRGVLDALVINRRIKLKDVAEVDNWNRVMANLELYEEFAWEITPPRAMLLTLREGRLNGNFDLHNKLLSAHDGLGRIPYGVPEQTLDDIEDLLRRVKDCRIYDSSLVGPNPDNVE